MPQPQSYKNMPIWQHCVRLAVQVYDITAQLPSSERQSLGINLLNEAIRLSTLLAGGSKVGKAGFKTAVYETRKAAAELESQLLTLQKIHEELEIETVIRELGEIEEALTVLLRRLSGIPEPMRDDDLGFDEPAAQAPRGQRPSFNGGGRGPAGRSPKVM
jgi:four helix bundle protein